jgi:hypothetical protein
MLWAARLPAAEGDGFRMSGGVLRCPRCAGSDDLRTSRRQWFDVFFMMLGLKAYRCRLCRTRFHSWKRLRAAGDEADADFEANREA